MLGFRRRGPRPEDEAAAAEACEQRGDLAGAAGHWQAAIAREPRLAWRTRLADNYLARRQFAEALALYTELDRLGADAWVGLFWCQFGLGHTEAAAAVLQKWEAVRPGYARPLPYRRVLQRWAEFAGTEAPAALPVKDYTYVYSGAVALGGPGDDGVQVPEYASLDLDYAGVARVLERFLGLVRQRTAVRVSAVVAGEPAAAPLAAILAQGLSARCCGPREVRSAELALLVQAAVPDLDALVAARNRLDTRLIGFCLGGSAAAGHLDWPVAALAVPVPITLPWGEVPDAAASEALGAALAALPPEPAARAAQVTWLAAHPRSNWAGI